MSWCRSVAARSRVVPRWICVLVVVAGAGYLIDSIGGLFDGYRIEFGSITFVGEVVLMIWLLSRRRSTLKSEHGQRNTENMDDNLGHQYQ